MNLYLLLKTLHILSSTILFGTGLGRPTTPCAPGAAGSCR